LIAQEEGGEEQQEAKKKIEFDDNMLAKRVWISECKRQNNYVVYCLFHNQTTDELELHSIGKNQGGGLLGQGENVQESMWFKRITIPIKITSAEGVDLSCSRDLTLIGINNFEQVYGLGCFDKGSQDHEEVCAEPKLLKICEQYKVLKMGSDNRNQICLCV